MKSTGFGNFMTQLLMPALGLILLVPCAYKLTAYVIFRCKAVAVDGIVDKAARGMELGSRPFVAYKDHKGNVHYIKSKAKPHWFYAPEKGEKIREFYRKNDPQTAMVESSFYDVLIVFLLNCILAHVQYHIRRDHFEPFVKQVQRSFLGSHVRISHPGLELFFKKQVKVLFDKFFIGEFVIVLGHQYGCTQNHFRIIKDSIIIETICPVNVRLLWYDGDCGSVDCFHSAVFLWLSVKFVGNIFNLF